MSIRPRRNHSAVFKASDARQRIGRFIEFYNTRRPHSSLGKNTPDEFYFASLPAIQQAA